MDKMLAALLRQLGMTPEMLQQMKDEATRVVQHFDARLVAIENRLQKIEAQNANANGQPSTVVSPRPLSPPAQQPAIFGDPSRI